MTHVTQSGLKAIGVVPRGSHLCHFYRSQADLEQVLVPYFKAGLLANERCLWITCKPLEKREAFAALESHLPDAAQCVATGQLEIINHSDWYRQAGSFTGEAVLANWLEQAESAIRAGYAGLRLTGNTLWLQSHEWEDFIRYEASLQQALHGRPIVALCSYSLADCSTSQVMSVLRQHHFAALTRAEDDERGDERVQGWELDPCEITVTHPLAAERFGRLMNKFSTTIAAADRVVAEAQALLTDKPDKAE